MGVEKVTALVLVSAVQERYKETRVPDAVLEHHSRRLFLHDGTTVSAGAKIDRITPRQRGDAAE